METVNVGSACACKGIRHCLLCEDPESQLNQNSLEAAKGYIYCCSCNGAWSDDNTVNCHPTHSGEFISFPGIDVIPDFVSVLEEQSLCDSIDAGEWTASQSGRYKQVLPACCPVAMTFCELSAEFTVDGAVDSFGKELVTVASNYDFGPKVNFKKRKVQVGSFAGLPLYSKQLVKRFAGYSCLTGFVPVELCNLEYLPERGSAIDPHFDDWWLWGERLVTLNLLSDTVLTFVDDSRPTLSVLVALPRRSLIVVLGPARYKWKHAIQRHHVTSRRIAMTFRELSAEFTVSGANDSVGKALITVASNFVS